MIIKHKLKNKIDKTLKDNVKQTKDKKLKKNKKPGTKKFIIFFVSSILFLIVAFLIYWFLILSSDNYLTKLTISGYDFDFKSDVQSYKLTVSHDTKILNIKTTKSDMDSIVKISDNAYDLDTGDNTVTITVISQNKKKRVYTLEVYRKYLEKSCIEGYELKNDECIKLEYINDATPSYSCTDEGELVNDKCVLYNSIKPSITKSCPDGYTRNNDKCSKFLTLVPTRTESCPDGYFKKDYGCAMEVTTEPSYTYYCYSGTLVGDMCRSSFTATPYKNSCQYSIMTGASCTLSGGVCYCYRYTGASKTYVCPTDYTYSNGTCVGYKKVSLNVEWVCPDGYTFDSSYGCKKTDVINVNINYICPDNYFLGNDYMCKKENKSYDAELNYICSDELTLCNDTQCCNRLTSEVIKTEY